MKVLVFGPSGAGKTYIAHALHHVGIHAFDGDEIEGLSGWYDKYGRRVMPETAKEALENQYSFVWKKKFLAAFLSKFSEVYIFGGSGNLFDMFDLFDRVYFLKVEPQLQRERILHLKREKPLMDIDEHGIVIWGDWLEREARKRQIPFLDATKNPMEIFEIISRQ